MGVWGRASSETEEGTPVRSLARWLRKPAETEIIACRDERCIIEELHPVHEIVDDPDSIHQRGWTTDPLEKQPARKRRFVAGSLDNRTIESRTVQPWENGCCDALDEAIIESCNRHRAKIFSEVYRDVLDRYGSVTERTVYRRLNTLVEARRVAYVKFPSAKGRTLTAKLSPGKVFHLRRRALHDELDLDCETKSLEGRLALLDGFARFLAFVSAEATTQVKIDALQRNYSVKVARGLAGYLSADSRLVADLDTVREQLTDAVQSSCS